MSKVPEIIQTETRILSNIRLKGNYYTLTLELPGLAQVVRPGQFVTLRVSKDHKPLLRRPFSIHGLVHSPCLAGRQGQSTKGRVAKLNAIEILYEVVGGGTEILSEKKNGEYLDVLGPLGNGFSIFNNRFSILVGGGMGVAPLFFLAQRLIERNTQFTIHNTAVLIGARTKKELLCKKKFAGLALNVKISTDDGTAGFKGKITDLLKQELSAIDNRLSTIYACGPKSMLAEISGISKEYNIPAQISLDEYMACGLGVCLGCMIETKEGRQRICKEGPVFDARMIIGQKG